jgi:hypothetical protein
LHVSSQKEQIYKKPFFMAEVYIKAPRMSMKYKRKSLFTKLRQKIFYRSNNRLLRLFDQGMNPKASF